MAHVCLAKRRSLNEEAPWARSGASRGSSELGLCACGLPAINKNLKCVGCLREANKRYLATKPPSRVCACGKRVQVARQCGACYQRDHPEEWRQRLVKRRKQDAARRMQNSGVAVSTRSLCSCGEPIYIGSMCANCFAESAGDLEATLLQEAEERRRSQICSTGKPTGLEPALQLLVLPPKNPLPSYAHSPTYVSPWHCRLCFQGFDVPCPTDQHSDIDDGGWKLHLQTHGFTSVAEYRQEFFRVCVATP